jgi:uncharacterized membrane protein
MTTINGLPAHALLLHFVLILAPLTALLEIVCGLWPAARRGQLLWLTAILAVVTMVLTPLTVNAGGWLYNQTANPSAVLQRHADLGGDMTYYSVALLVVAIALVVLRLVERRSDKRHIAATVAIAILVLAVGVSSMIQIYRVGDAGAQAVWGGSK